MEFDGNPLSRKELREIDPYLDGFGQRELLAITGQLASHYGPHFGKSPDKRKKCLLRAERIADSTTMLRRNLLRIIQLTYLGKRPSQRIRKQKIPQVPLRLNPFPPCQKLRGGLNNDGPLIPDRAAHRITGISHMLDLAERWDDKDEARDLRTRKA